MTPMENYYTSFLNLLSTYNVPGTVSGSGNIVMNKTDKNPCFCGIYILLFLPDKFIMKVLLSPFFLVRKVKP